MKPLIVTIFVFMPVFALRLAMSQAHFSEGDRVRITTLLAQEPTISGNQQLIRTNQIRIYLPRFPEYHYGDRLEITGTVTASERGLYLKDPEAKLAEKHGFLPEIRRRMVSLFTKALPQPESSLAAGITFGVKEGFTPEFYNSLKNAGVLHVVVASGTNVTLVARVLIATLVLFATRRVAIIAALSGIWLYAFLVGLEAPITRAAIMGSLVFSAQELGRVYFAWWGLLLSGIVMLLANPGWITDIGFLLSFGATAGILAFEAPIKNFLTNTTKKLISYFRPPANSFELKRKSAKLQEDSEIRSNTVKTVINDLSTSFSAGIFVTPILLVAFHQFSPWSPLVNGLLLWTVGPIMGLGFSGALIGLLFEPLGKLIIFLTYPLAFLFVKVVSLF